MARLAVENAANVPDAVAGHRSRDAQPSEAKAARLSRTFFVGSLPDAQLISVPMTFSSAGGSVSAIKYVFVCRRGHDMKVLKLAAAPMAK